jgi:hypothetical protein
MNKIELNKIRGNLRNKEFSNWSFPLIHKYSDEILIVNCYLLNTFLLPYTSSYTYCISVVEGEFLKPAMPI